MSKKQFKAHASSSRAFSENSGPTVGFGPQFVASGSFGAASSILSYLAEQPDLSGISDPNVVVSFKNLSKKDSTTKAKAIEDLQIYVTFQHEHQKEIEETFLDAWVGGFHPNCRACLILGFEFCTTLKELFVFGSSSFLHPYC